MRNHSTNLFETMAQNPPEATKCIAYTPKP